MTSCRELLLIAVNEISNLDRSWDQGIVALVMHNTK